MGSFWALDRRMVVLRGRPWTTALGFWAPGMRSPCPQCSSRVFHEEQSERRGDRRVLRSVLGLLSMVLICGQGEPTADPKEDRRETGSHLPRHPSPALQLSRQAWPGSSGEPGQGCRAHHSTRVLPHGSHAEVVTVPAASFLGTEDSLSHGLLLRLGGSCSPLQATWWGRGGGPQCCQQGHHGAQLWTPAGPGSVLKSGRFPEDTARPPSPPDGSASWGGGWLKRQEVCPTALETRGP